MKYFALDLTVLSPLAIRADHAPDGAATTPYISGTALAGSLAGVHRLLYPTAEENFARLFLSEQIQYPNLYPASLKKAEKQDDAKKQAKKQEEQEQNNSQTDALPVYPLPKTARSCKRFPGFRPLTDHPDEEAGHGVRDTLFDWAIFELGDRSHASLRAGLLGEYELPGEKKKQKKQDCRQCGKAMHRFSGFYRRWESTGDGSSARMAQTSVETRLQTHTGIDRRTGTVRDGVLYQRQVYEEGSHFSGIIKVPENEQPAGELQRFIKQVGENGLVRIGTGRTRGLGKVKIILSPISDKQFGFAAFKARLTKFDRVFQERAGSALRRAGASWKPGRFYFALTLHAPALIRDELLRYRGSIDETTLHELTKLSLTGLERIYQAAGTTRVTGWNELWGMPKMQELAIESGSVFLFACPAPANDTLYDALFKLEEEGIGQRRGEGFGRVCVSDPFHLEEMPR